MRWRCRRVRTQLALLVGDDLTELERRKTEAHAAKCASCRAYLESLDRSREFLLQSRVEPAAQAGPSLWPALKSKLSDSIANRRPRPVWLPSVAMAAAGVAIAVMLWHRPAASTPISRFTFQSSQSSRPRGVQSVEAVRDAADAVREFPARRTNRPVQLPVRSFYLLESGRPATSTDEEL